MSHLDVVKPNAVSNVGNKEVCVLFVLWHFDHFGAGHIMIISGYAAHVPHHMLVEIAYVS